MFQSTRPRGARRRGLVEGHVTVVVSIHAPAWGATFAVSVAQPLDQVSIHAPAWGATFPRCTVSLDRRFQSTRPRGARPVSTGVSRITLLFQSTRPRGARHCGRWPKPCRHNVSIHAPAWGATPSRCRLAPSPCRFNPRARVGRDACECVERPGCQQFQSTRPRGARPAPEDQAPVRRCFNPRARVGRDLVDNPGYEYEDVSIHAPAWGATYLDPQGR